MLAAVLDNIKGQRAPQADAKAQQPVTILGQSWYIGRGPIIGEDHQRLQIQFLVAVMVPEV